MAVDNGVVQAGWNGTVNPGGLNGRVVSVSSNGNFYWEETVNVSVYAEDNAAVPNFVSSNYSFSIVNDTVKPYLTAVVTAKGASGVATNALVQVTFNDFANAVALGTVTVKIDGVLAVSGGAVQAGWQGSVTPGGLNGYVVSVRSNGGTFDWSAVVNVSVYAEDTAGTPNTRSSNYSFTIFFVIDNLVLSSREVPWYSFNIILGQC